MAPEVLKNIPYDQAADMWSVGVILFVILSGHPPFADDVQSALFEKIRMGEYTMNSSEWTDISEDAKQLVRSLLQVNPQQRWTAKQALHCRWLVEDDPRLSNVVLADTYRLIKKRKCRLKNVAKTEIWMNKHSLRGSETAIASATGSDSDDAEDEDTSSTDDLNAYKPHYSERSIAELMAGATNNAVFL